MVVGVEVGEGVGVGVGVGVRVVGGPMVGVLYGLREDWIWLILTNSMTFQDLARLCNYECIRYCKLIK